MFKLLSIVCCIAVTMITIQAAPQQFTNKFDNVNVDEILNNDRLLSSYFKCLMDTGKCTPEGEELKGAIPDALSNKCANCSEKQKEMGEKVIKFLYEKKNDYFKELVGKYDPEGKYTQDYMEEAKKLNIQV